MELFFVAAHQISDALGWPLRLGYLSILVFFAYLFVRWRRDKSSLSAIGLKLMISWLYLSLISSLLSNDVWSLHKIGLFTLPCIAIGLSWAWRKKRIVYGITGMILTLLLFAVLTSIYELIQYASGSLSSFSDLPRASPSDSFFDLHIWTSNLSDCPIDISALKGENHCASRYYVFDYPKYILFPLRQLGLTSAIHSWLGISLGAVAYILTAYSFFDLGGVVRTSKVHYVAVAGLLATVCVVSLPLRYAVERGQVDLVVYNIFCLYYLCRCKKWVFGEGSAHLSGYLTLIITALIKIYSLASLIYISLLDAGSLLVARVVGRQVRTKRLVFSISGIFLAVICGFALSSDIDTARAANSFFLGGHGFGFSTLLDAAYSKSFPFSGLGKSLVAFISICIGLSYGKELVSSSALALNVINTSNDSKSLRFSCLQSKASVEIFLMVAPFMVALYSFTESINYKLIFLILLVPLWLNISFKVIPACESLRLFSILQLSAVFCRFLLLSLPFDPSQYLYSEWVIHFFCDPVIIGGTLSMLIILSLHSLLSAAIGRSCNYRM